MIAVLLILASVSASATGHLEHEFHDLNRDNDGITGDHEHLIPPFVPSGFDASTWVAQRQVTDRTTPNSAAPGDLAVTVRSALALLTAVQQQTAASLSLLGRQVSTLIAVTFQRIG